METQGKQIGFTSILRMVNDERKKGDRFDSRDDEEDDGGGGATHERQEGIVGA